MVYLWQKTKKIIIIEKNFLPKLFIQAARLL